MKLEITLEENELHDAIAEYLEKRGYKVLDTYIGSNKRELGYGIFSGSEYYATVGVKK